jgi:hypothetical protein
MGFGGLKMKRGMWAVVTAAALAWIGAGRAHAGYIAATGPDTVNNIDHGGSLAAQIGDEFQINGGHFSSYTPDGPSDPQLTGADLAHYRYNMDGFIASFGSPIEINYTGTYFIFYDSNSNGVYNAGTDFRVSAGTFTMAATFFASNSANYTGTEHQTQGPELSPPFRDLSYGGHDTTIAGTYVGDDSNGGLTGTSSGTITQTAAAPLPNASFAGLALIGGLAVAGGLKRVRRA